MAHPSPSSAPSDPSRAGQGDEGTRLQLAANNDCEVEAAEPPLRLNEATDLAGVLGVKINYLLTPPLTGLSAASQDLRELLRLEEIAEKLEAEAEELHRECKRKTEDAQTAARAARPRRVSPLEEALSNQGSVFHPIHPTPEE